MYGKLFESMYDGTLVSNWEALVTFQQMIILADNVGVVDITPHALSARTGIPLNHILAGIEVLESEDNYSRSDIQGGIRIERLDSHRNWGWKIVNYMYYRNLASHEDKKRNDRERIAAKRANENKDVADCRKVSQDVVNVAHTDTDTDTKNNSACDEKFNTFWTNYPKKKNKKKSKTAFNNLTVKNQEIATKDCLSRYSETEYRFIPLATTYIHGENWNDEKNPMQGNSDNDFIL